MQVRSTALPSGVGISTIYTSNHNQVADFCPSKKPYIVFCLPYTPDNVEYINSTLSKFKKLGIWLEYKGQLFIAITSDRKVDMAIKEFKTLGNEYNPILNYKLFIALNELQIECQRNLKNKRISLPKQSRPLSDYQVKNKTGIDESANVTHRIFKTKSPGKEYVYKENTSGRTISEIEAFNAYCYRMLLGERHPKVRVVHKDLGERAGLISEIIPFTSFFEKYKAFSEGDKSAGPSTQELLSSEVVKTLVAAYVFEEDDLHRGNMGIGKDGYVVKIDDDRSAWPQTAKYADVMPNQVRNKHLPAPVNAFPINKDDILDFPKLTHAKPRHWIDKIDGFMPTEELVKEQKFQDDKYYMFLKSILIPPSAYQAVGLACMSSDKQRKKIVDHRIKRMEELENVLMGMPEFTKYIFNNPEVIVQIIKEFENYSDEYKKDKDAYLRINISEVISHFNNILSMIYQDYGDQKKAIPETGVIVDLRQLVTNTVGCSDDEKRKLTALLSILKSSGKNLADPISDSHRLIDNFIKAFNTPTVKKAFITTKGSEIAKKISQLISSPQIEIGFFGKSKESGFNKPHSKRESDKENGPQPKK